MINPERFSEAARFALTAVELGLHVKHPLNSGLGAKTWERNVDITLTYLLGAKKGQSSNRLVSMKDVGKEFPKCDGTPLSKERVSQITTKTLSLMYATFCKNLPPGQINDYSLEEIKQIEKPFFLVSPIGSTRHILEDWENGLQDYAKLRQKYSSNAILHARKTLRLYGIILSYERKPNQYRELINQFRDANRQLGNEELQFLLNRVNHSIMVRYRSFFDLYFIPLSTLLREHGFHFRNDQLSIFVAKLGALDTPIGKEPHIVKSGRNEGKNSTYYYVFRFQGDTIGEALLPDPELAKFHQAAKT